MSAPRKPRAKIVRPVFGRERPERQHHRTALGEELIEAARAVVIARRDHKRAEVQLDKAIDELATLVGVPEL